MKNELDRSIKTPGAILMGLGSIVGTGIFVSIAIATQIAGNYDIHCDCRNTGNFQRIKQNLQQHIRLAAVRTNMVINF